MAGLAGLAGCFEDAATLALTAAIELGSDSTGSVLRGSNRFCVETAYSVGEVFDKNSLRLADFTGVAVGEACTAGFSSETISVVGWTSIVSTVDSIIPTSLAVFPVVASVQKVFVGFFVLPLSLPYSLSNSSLFVICGGMFGGRIG